MTRYIKSDYNQHVAINTTSTLHTGAGKILAIILTNSSTTSQITTLYDNTAASGNILSAFNVAAPNPLVIIFPYNYPMQFSTGLTVVTGANTTAFIITEA